jgi:hypothetical protein
LDDEEIRFIEEYNTLHPHGLNLNRGGDTHLPSDLTKKRMSEASREDLTGMRFGRLVAETYCGGSKWNCKCDCGKRHIAHAYCLKKGLIRSCGCLRKDSSKSRMKDLTGQRFGNVTVVGLTGRKTGHNLVWECLCDCGNKCEIASSNLRRYEHVSCGCYSTIQRKMPKVDLTGQRFGHLTVVSRAYCKGHNQFWNCRCDCGKDCIIRGDHLKSGASKSCGCQGRFR